MNDRGGDVEARGTGMPVPSGLLAVAGLAVAAGLVVGLAGQRRPPSSGRGRESRRDHAWRAYLIDHLAGSDTALAVVSRVAATHGGSPEGALCAWLRTEFKGERVVMDALLARSGRAGVALAARRLAGAATGVGAQALAGGRRGDLSLFRAIESLAIAVQSKRLLWRAAQARVPTSGTSDRNRFRDLEAAALRQWQRIETCRLSMVPPTFRPADCDSGLPATAR